MTAGADAPARRPLRGVAGPPADAQDLIPLAPFAMWLREQRYVPDELRRYAAMRDGDPPQMLWLVERAVVENALLDTGLWELAEPRADDVRCAFGVDCDLRARMLTVTRRQYDDGRKPGPQPPTLLTAWCPSCHQQVVPNDDGTCVWCDEQTGGADVPPVEPPPAPTPLAQRRRMPRRPEIMAAHGIEQRGTCFYVRGSDDATVCICGGRKGKQALTCRDCRAQFGYQRNTGPRPRQRGPQGMTDAQLLEARERYLAGDSFNVIAKSMLPQTSYASWRTLSSALCRQFKARGWPARERIAATVAASYKHGLKPRSGPRYPGRSVHGYARYRREQAALPGERADKQPQCIGVRQQYPRKGERCQRPASPGSPYCYSHDPELDAVRREFLADVRAGRSPRHGLPARPFRDWLIALHDELGSWREVASRMVAPDGRTFEKLVIYQYAYPNGSRDSEWVLRSTVQRIVDAARRGGMDVSVESIYEPTMVVRHTPRVRMPPRPFYLDVRLDVRRAVLERYAETGSVPEAAQVAADRGIFASPEAAAHAIRDLLTREGWWTRPGKAPSARARAAAAAQVNVRRALEDGTWDRVVEQGLVPSRRQVLDERLLHDAAWLYFYDELGFGTIAKRLLHRSSASDWDVLKAALIQEWDQRGWPRRTRKAAGRWTPPAEQQICTATTTKGKPCRRYAQKGKSVCFDHDDERMDERVARNVLASQRAYEDAVPILPWRLWLRARVAELGSVKALHREIGGVVGYDTLADWTNLRPRSGSRDTVTVVRRSTIECVLDAYSEDVTFEDIYVYTPVAEPPRPA